jgi:hypothetical protein
MAKTKKKSPGTPPPPGRGGGKGQTTLPKPAPASPGGPNRLERKEEARRQREALQRKMGRRKAYRIVGIVVAVLVLATAITGFVIYQSGATGRLIRAAGCSPVRTTPLYDPAKPEVDRQHIAQGSPVPTPPPLSTYPTTPPASGPHTPQTLPAGVQPSPPDVYTSIHSLEHGAVAIWYAPNADATEVGKVSDFYNSSANNDHVIVAPYSYPDQGTAGQLPAGKQVVIVAWHRLQACTLVSLQAIQEFVRFYRVPTGGPRPDGYRGEAPEAGSAI